MGLFDGVKEAFGADGMGDLDSERETPIDRWMGWNTKTTDGAQPKDVVGSKGEFWHVCFMISLEVWVQKILVYSNILQTSSSSFNKLSLYLIHAILIIYIYIHYSTSRLHR